MRSFEIEQSTEATLTAHAGLALVGRALAQRTSLAQRLAAIPLHHGVPHADCVRSYIGLLATGKSDFLAIETMSGVCFFQGSTRPGPGPARIDAAPVARRTGKEFPADNRRRRNEMEPAPEARGGLASVAFRKFPATCG